MNEIGAYGELMLEKWRWPLCLVFIYSDLQLEYCLEPEFTMDFLRILSTLKATVRRIKMHKCGLVSSEMH